MTEFTDPRTIAGFKSKFVDERIALLLGAILDQLIAKSSVALPEPVKPISRKPKKAE